MTTTAATISSVDAASHLAWALAQHAEVGGWHTIVLPVPISCEPLAFPAPSAVFDAPRGVTLVGVGVARTIAADRHALDTVQREATRHYGAIRVLPAAVEVLDHVGHAPWMGGVAFADAPITDQYWQGFPTTAFLIPRWTFQRAPMGWTATLTIGPETRSPAHIEGLQSEWWALTRKALAKPAGHGERLTTALASRDPAWLARIERALGAIADGRVEKVVLARHLDLPRELAPRLADILARLAERFPSCTRFMLTSGGSEFFGASPEMLVRQDGLAVETEALAGSSAPAGAPRLAGSDKDQREHALVADALVAALQPRCTSVIRTPVPKLRRLANVAHLVTAIQGTLARPGHVLDLLTRLHPTPATAGTPTGEALALLRAIEPVERGWYAGPVGWFDAYGNGHFVVGLRSAVRSPHGVRVYAGSGIVRGSNPQAELDEMALKMRAIREVLGSAAAESAS